jgi:hypothetical protein
MIEMPVCSVCNKQMGIVTIDRDIKLWQPSSVEEGRQTFEEVRNSFEGDVIDWACCNRLCNAYFFVTGPMKHVYEIVDSVMFVGERESNVNE